MELKIHFKNLPEAVTFDEVKADLSTLLEDDGWILGSTIGEAGGHIDIELEDEKANPKYGILTVKGYLQKAAFPKDTAIELCGTPVGIYE